MKVLIVVDMQKDFIDGTLGTKEAQAIVPKVLERVQNSDHELVLFTLDTHQEDYLDTPEGQKLPVVHCIKNSPGWQPHPDIMAAWRNNATTIHLDNEEQHIFEKPVFGSVALVSFLKERAEQLEEVELLGLCTDICVVSNAIMIKNTLPHVAVKVNGQCSAGVTPQSHQEALNTMAMCQIDIL